jgi:hypothetical protein
MALWIFAGYIATAVVFYSYIVATAQDDPADRETRSADTPDWQLGKLPATDQGKRKAA